MARKPRKLLPGQKRKSAFPPGPANPASRERRAQTGAGRAKGTGNKITNDIRLHIINAINAAGGENWFKQLAEQNRRDMAGLVKAIIPRKLETGMDPEEAAVTIRQQLRAMESATDTGEDDGME